VHEYGFVLADGADVLPRLLLDDFNQALDQLRLYRWPRVGVGHRHIHL
jgi:hypothetical protein